jgi:hypothetical protein
MKPINKAETQFVLCNCIQDILQFHYSGAHLLSAIALSTPGCLFLSPTKAMGFQQPDWRN